MRLILNLQFSLLQFLVTLTQLLPLKYQQELMESLILSKTIRVVLE